MYKALIPRELLYPLFSYLLDIFLFLYHSWGRVTVSQNLLQDLLPGPVTLVFERTEQLNPQLNPGTRLVGIRIPDYDFVRQLAVACQEPLALTSANVSAAKSSLKTEVSKNCIYFMTMQRLVIYRVQTSTTNWTFPRGDVIILHSTVF